MCLQLPDMGMKHSISMHLSTVTSTLDTQCNNVRFYCHDEMHILVQMSWSQSGSFVACEETQGSATIAGLEKVEASRGGRFAQGSHFFSSL